MEVQPQNREGRETPGGRGGTFPTSERPYKDVCLKCGAYRVDQQLGLEPTPDAYVQSMVEVFREVRRVLRKDGTAWVNLGDTYNSRLDGSHGGWNGSSPEPQRTKNDGAAQKPKYAGKPKDLVGIPWRVAFALQADGWYLRSDIIWSKPNPMPESVTDRPAKAHEYLFLLTKSPRYFYDADAIREPAEYGYRPTRGGNIYDRVGNGGSAPVKTPGVVTHGGDPSTGRNRRSVWEIATEPYPDAHFATFPQALVEPCVRAGTSERGCCPVCGAPWVREVERTSHVHRPLSDKGRGSYPADSRSLGQPQQNGRRVTTETLGWSPSCDHEHQPVPCTVLDCFSGSGTTALVARKHGRRSIGIELNQEYADLAAKRLSQLSLLAG
jgi:DNA modification methylase